MIPHPAEIAAPQRPIPTDDAVPPVDDSPEEVEIDSYMDEENAAADEKPTEDQWKEYLSARYAQVKQSYGTLLCHLREAQAGKRDEMIPEIRMQFAQNYRNRKVIVRELRRMGEKIEDRFIAG